MKGGLVAERRHGLETFPNLQNLNIVRVWGSGATDVLQWLPEDMVDPTMFFRTKKDKICSALHG